MEVKEGIGVSVVMAEVTITCNYHCLLFAAVKNPME